MIWFYELVSLILDAGGFDTAHAAARYLIFYSIINLNLYHSYLIWFMEVAELTTGLQSNSEEWKLILTSTSTITRMIFQRYQSIIRIQIHWSLIDGRINLCYLVQMRNLTKEEFVHVLRRQSTGFPKGSSKYRGVTLHKCGRWEARMGQFLAKKYNYSILFVLQFCLPSGSN